MRIFLLPILLFLSSYLSAQPKTETQNNPTTIKVDVEGPFCETTLEMFQIKRVIPLETTDESIFADVYKILPYKDRFILYDFGQKSVLSFDTNGKFISRIGKEGRGPGEFIQPSDVAIGEDGCVGIADNMQQKILLYDTEGNHIKDARHDLRFWAVGLLNKENIFLYNTFQNNKGDRHNVYQIGAKGKLKNTFFPFSEKMQGYNYTSFDLFTRNEKQFLYRRTYSDTIFTLHENKFKPNYILDFGAYSFDEKFFINYEGNHFYVQNSKEYNFAEGISCFYDVGDYFLFKYGFNRGHRTVVYSKKTGQVKSYLHKGGKEFFAFLWPISACKKEVYCILMPDVLENLEQKLSKMDYPEEEKQRFRELAKQVEITDNPVVVVCEIKDF